MANSINLGSVYATLELKANQWKSDIDKAKGQIDDLEKTTSSKLQAIGKSSGAVGTALSVGLTAPIAAIGVTSIKTAADFEQGMSTIKALTGSTGNEMEKLRKLALQAGADTAFSAKEAAAGMEELLKAGVSVEDVIGGGLYGALNLATAGGIDLAAAAEIASTALNAFKNDKLSVAKAGDILAGAANASATSVGELRMGLSQASAVAAGFGLSFKDTTTALAVFAQNGLKGSDAGTSLKTMLMNLQPVTEDQIALFDQLGLTTADGANQFFTAEGKIKSLSEISGVLQKSLTGLTDQQKQATLEMIFGSDAIRAGIILSKEGSEGFNNMANAMSKVTAADVAREKLNNLNGSVEMLKGSIETAQIIIGDKFIGAIRGFADGINTLVDGFLKLSPQAQNFIVIFGGLVALIGPLLVGFSILTASMTTIATAFGVALLPVLGIVAALFALAAVVALVIAYWAPISAFFIGLWEQIKAIFDAAWLSIVAFFTTSIPAFIASVIAFFEALPMALLNMFGNLLLWLLSWIVTLGALLLLGTAKLVMDMIGWFRRLPENTQKFMEEVKQWFLQKFKEIEAFVTVTVPQMVANIITWFKELPKRLQGILSEMNDNTKSGFSSMWAAIVAEVSSWPGKLYDWGSKMISAFADGIRNAFGKVTEAVKEGLERARGMLEGHSPPVEGPWKDIDIWGGNVGMAWVEGFSDSMAMVKDYVGDPNMSMDIASSGNFDSGFGTGNLGTTTTTNSPTFEINIGMYAGTEMEKREVAKQIIDAYADYQRSIGTISS